MKGEISDRSLRGQPHRNRHLRDQKLRDQPRAAARRGLAVTTQTLWDQQAALARHLEPTWRKLWDLALLEDILHVDETGWKMMGSKTKSKWTLFGLTAPHLAVYHLASSKSANNAGPVDLSIALLVAELPCSHWDQFCRRSAHIPFASSARSKG